MKRFLILTLLFIGVIVVTSAIAQPPTGLSDTEKLGRHLYKDKNLSYNGTQSCQNCHHPFAGFADRTNLINPYDNVVSTGADGISKGGRNAPTAAYAGFSPLLTFSGGEWAGGLFWDGRATGSMLGDPLAEQAQGPPLNPVEMAMPSKDAIIEVIKTSNYANLFLRVFGLNAFDDVDLAYDNFGRAVAAYERSTEVTKFTSKYDVARNQFTPAEERGLALFEAKCSACHSTTIQFSTNAALFTNYKYANIGAPANPLVPVPPDLGLGPIVDDTTQDGKFKVPTLRNIAVTPPYTHNGNFPTLPEMVAFINNSSGFTPEVEQNIDDRVGSLGLSNEDINDIVTFLMTLTDDY
ncbi:MAG: cytochrome c peroxidase [Pseudomonadota bacterium]